MQLAAEPSAHLRKDPALTPASALQRSFSLGPLGGFSADAVRITQSRGSDADTANTRLDVTRWVLLCLTMKKKNAVQPRSLLTQRLIWCERTGTGLSRRCTVLCADERPDSVERQCRTILVTAVDVTQRLPITRPANYWT